MPSTSKKQSRFMQAVAHSPSFAKKVGVSQSVGKDFSTADKGRKFADGGGVDWGKRAAAAREEVRRSQSDDPTPTERAEMERVRQEAKQKAQEDKAPTTRTTMPKFASGGVPKANINKQDTKHGKMDMPFTSLNRLAGMKKGGNVKESKSMMNKEVAFFKKKGAPASMVKHEQKEAKEMKFAKGGGIESRGKTKGTIVKMASGGAVKGFARGGGIESRGKTRGKVC